MTSNNIRVRTCAELGVCQGRADCDTCDYDALALQERLSGADYPFAPGVLQCGPKRVRRGLLRKLLGALLAGVALAAAVLVLTKGAALW
ncbi:hypothetical protein [Simplicispira psychrophila]|uniref:hypothetical protein n=1 Tax=Simplicispira psychrophila TaxID=80882 RepID=UPI0004814F27|nr:hypothetical protein [Simplicispira psychrophila]